MDAKKKFILSKEKNIVDKILSYVSEHKIVFESDEYYDFVMLLEELFEVDASIYDIRYVRGRLDNEVSFNVRKLKTDETSGLCYNNITLNSEGRFIRDNVEIVVNNNTHYFSELESDFPEYRVKGAKKIIKTVFHELTHLYQLKSFVTHLSNGRALRNAKEFIFIEGRYGSSQIYKKNHNSFAIENEADYNAHMRFEYLIDDNYDKRRKIECLSKYYSSDLVINRGNRKIAVSRDDLINQYVDFMVVSKKSKYLLMKYPILQKEYTFECKRKTFEELALKYLSEINNVTRDNSINSSKKSSLIRDIKEMYFSLFQRSIMTSTREEMDRVISILGVETFEEMIDFNNSRAMDEERVLYQLYFERESKASRFNFLKRNFKCEYIVYTGEENQIYNDSDFKLLVNFDSFSDEEKDKIEKYFITHIPRCGFILTKDGELMEPHIFFDEYFVPEMENMHDIDSFFAFLEKFTQSENKLLFEVGRRRIKYAKNKKNYYCEEVVRAYSGEMKK